MEGGTLTVSVATELVMLPWELLAVSVSVTMVMALLSGLWALRSLRLIEPVALLR